MKLHAFVDGTWRETLQEEAEAAAPAISAAVRLATDGLKGSYRAQVRSAGLGNKLANTWRSNHYQQGQINAAGYVFSKAASIMAGYQEGGVIRANRAQWLLIPTEEAGGQIRRRRVTPKLWERANGVKLRPVFVQGGGLGLLIAPPLQKGGKDRVIFLLVRQVKLQKRLDLDPPAQEWEAKLPQLVVDNWRAGGAR